MALVNVLHWGIYLFLTAFILILLLPFSPHPKVRYYGCFASCAFFKSLTDTVLIPFFLLRPRDVRNTVTAAEIQKHISKLVGIQWDLRGAEILEVERGAVIVINHQSMFDLLGALSIWKTVGRGIGVMKKELLYVFPYGLASWLCGSIFIDRKNPKEAKLQLDRASHLITKQKTKLWIFPEGTRNNNQDTLLPFKKGAFRIAVTCQVPIIPVVYSPYYFIDNEKKYFGQGQVVIQCMEPVSTEGKTEKDIDSIMEEVRGKMMKQYEMLKNEMLVNKQTCTKD